MSLDAGSTVLTEGGQAPPAGTAQGGNPNGDGAQAALDAVRDGPPEYIPAKFWDPEKKAPKIEDLGKGYINLERLLGREKVPVPTGDDDEEGWNRAYDALGRPAKPDDYEFERPTDLPKDLPYDEDAEKNFRVWAHVNGLNKRQARALYDGYVKSQIERHGQYQQAQAQLKAQAMAAMQREFGGQYEAKIGRARAALQKYADPDYLRWLDESGQGNDPRMIRAWIRIGEEMAGDERLKGAPQPQQTVQDAQRAISEFRAKHEKVLYDRNHPDHELRVRELRRLFEAAYPQ